MTISWRSIFLLIAIALMQPPYRISLLINTSGVYITNNLSWHIHVNYICGNANQTLGYLCCDLSNASVAPQKSTIMNTTSPKARVRFHIMGSRAAHPNRRIRVCTKPLGLLYLYELFSYCKHIPNQIGPQSDWLK